MLHCFRQNFRQLFSTNAFDERYSSIFCGYDSAECSVKCCQKIVSRHFEFAKISDHLNFLTVACRGLYYNNKSGVKLKRPNREYKTRIKRFVALYVATEEFVAG